MQHHLFFLGSFHPHPPTKHIDNYNKQNLFHAGIFTKSICICTNGPDGCFYCVYPGLRLQPQASLGLSPTLSVIMVCNMVRQQISCGFIAEAISKLLDKQSTNESHVSKLRYRRSCHLQLIKFNLSNTSEFKISAFFND